MPPRLPPGGGARPRPSAATGSLPVGPFAQVSRLVCSLEQRRPCRPTMRPGLWLLVVPPGD
eukprot:11215522-Lingulodinium_polyedra.AAC.1